MIELKITNITKQDVETILLMYLQQTGELDKYNSIIQLLDTQNNSNVLNIHIPIETPMTPCPYTPQFEEDEFDNNKPNTFSPTTDKESFESEDEFETESLNKTNEIENSTEIEEDEVLLPIVNKLCLKLLNGQVIEVEYNKELPDLQNTTDEDFINFLKQYIYNAAMVKKEEILDADWCPVGNIIIPTETVELPKLEFADDDLDAI